MGSRRTRHGFTVRSTLILTWSLGMGSVTGTGQGQATVLGERRRRCPQHRAATRGVESRHPPAHRQPKTEALLGRRSSETHRLEMG